MTVLHRLLAAFLLLKLANLAVNLVAFPRLTRTPASAPEGGVSLLVPARDEASTLIRTLPGFLDQPVTEVLLLDDGSRDGTAQVAAVAAARDPRLRVIHGAPRPVGWTGKTWACHQLAGAAAGTTLLFCDADVHLRPGAVAALGDQMRRQQADVFSVFARQVTGTLPERLLAPVLEDVLLCFLPHPLLRTERARSAATASGGLLAFRRSAYDRVGGFAAVRDELVEDVALARRTRRSGLRLGLALGGDLASTRMWQGYAEAVANLGRGVHGVVGRRPWLLVGAGAWHLAAYTLPLLLVRRPRWRWLLVAGVVERLAVEAKTARRQWLDALLMPLTPPALLPVLARAARREQRWKGRVYR